MTLFDLILIAVSLSMDAFAVSICKGLSVRKVSLQHAMICGVWFGGFQFLMPALGYFLGDRFAALLTKFGPWIAFVLLALIGTNMIKESFGGDEQLDDDYSAKAMLPLAIATSIDAFAVGVSFAAMQVDILPAAGLIGVITCLLSAIGVKVGAMFGDNLSFISDTTIAATRTQGCEMGDKFRMNFFIVLPAAILTLVIFIALTWGGSGQPEIGTYSVWKVLPYLVVLVGAVAGVNVFLILTIGAVLSLIVGVASGAFPWTQIFSVMGTGITAMYDITVISIVVACIGALVREYGGIQWLIDFVHRRANSKRGAQLGIAGLVAAVDVATANNTVAIVMTGSIAKDISQEYHIDPRRSASLLDIFASVMQGILPYGAQLLYASAGTGVSAVKIMPYMFYCYLMAVCALVFILFWPDRKRK